MDRVECLILAGGFGTRLRPAVGECPKVLAPVGGEPFIMHLLRRLAAAGVRRATLCTGWRAERVAAELGDCRFGVALRYSPEPEPLGTGGAVALAARGLPAGDELLVMNGDSFCAADLPALVAEHRRRRADRILASLVAVRVSDADRYGALTLDPDGRVLAFTEKQPDGGPGVINAGIYLLEREALGARETGRAFSLERDLFPSLAAAGALAAVTTDAAFVDIGTPESWARAAAVIASARAAEIGTGSAGEG